MFSPRIGSAGRICVPVGGTLPQATAPESNEVPASMVPASAAPASLAPASAVLASAVLASGEVAVLLLELLPHAASAMVEANVARSALLMAIFGKLGMVVISYLFVVISYLLFLVRAARPWWAGEGELRWASKSR